MRIVMIALMVFLFPFLSNAQLTISDVNFTPMAALPQFGYIFGTLKVKHGKLDKTRLAFKKGTTVYALVLDNATQDTPELQVDAMSFANNGVVLGLFEKDSRQAWIFFFGIKDATIVVNDVVKYGKLDRLDYDFYFNMSPIDTPKQLVDIDNDGLCEIELDFYQRRFRMNLEVGREKLRIDYTSPNYLKEYNRAKKNLTDFDDYQYREYLLSGILSGQITVDNALNIASKKDKTDEKNVPNVILQAVNLKKLAVKYGVSSQLASYFSGQAEINVITDALARDKQNPSELMFAINELEKSLNHAQLDEVAFSEFSSFFADTISLDDFKSSAKNTLVTTSSDINSILRNVKALNSSIHNAPKFKFEVYTLKKQAQ